MCLCSMHADHAKSSRMHTILDAKQLHKDNCCKQGLTALQVSMTEFMTDDDLEALKEESNAEAATEGQGISYASLNNINSDQKPIDSSLLSKFFGQSTAGAPGSHIAVASYVAADANHTCNAVHPSITASLQSIRTIPNGIARPCRNTQASSVYNAWVTS